ncbi:MAG: glycogen/starch synthase [Phycisphaerae bacterium]|nr:glycogen/starch synthase [Phycisphaerae bacterium]
MPLVTFYFELHQPFRLNTNTELFLWKEKDSEVFNKVAHKCYIPATQMFTKAIKNHPNFKVTFSMSGTFLEQAEKYNPQVIEELRKLYEAGQKNNQVEFLEETYYHSLTALFEDPKKTEFRKQVSMHRQKMRELFGCRPTSFRNTELMYNNEIANTVADMGYEAILCEQRNDMLVDAKGNAVSPHAVFHCAGDTKKVKKIVVIPRHRDLSDDVAFRFSGGGLSADDYARSLSKIDGEVIMLGYDYEHIGEHIWQDTGIFDFWAKLPEALEKYPNVVPANPTEIAKNFKDVKCPIADIHPLSTSSWADIERNTHGWLGNQTQYTLFKELEGMEEDVKKANVYFQRRWRYLTTSDHLYYLHEGTGPDRGVHDYFSPYGSLATATYLLTRNLSLLANNVKRFNVVKDSKKTPIILISPETAKLPNHGMGNLAKYVSGKSGGMGDVVSAICQGLTDRNLPVHLITLNLQERFQKESRITKKEWVDARYKLDPQNIHLVTSSVFENYQHAYEGNIINTAAEFQRQIINNYMREILVKYDGRGIIHSHDWMAGGSIAAYAKLRQIPLLHTIHNTHTCLIPVEAMQGVNLIAMWHDLYIRNEHGKECIDAQATAIKSATRISYVGKTFLKEIVQNHFMDRNIIPESVRNETKVKHFNKASAVIPNGISPDVYPENQIANTSLDKPGLAVRYGPTDDVIEAKRTNLLKFQHQMGLNSNADAILLYWPSRLDQNQKGVEILEDIAGKFVYENPDVQIAIVGNPVGDDMSHKEILGRIAYASGGRIAYHHFDEELSKLGYAAASDVFGASLYEPFGQIDVVGNIYGATTTNRNTGGYHDKIEPLALKAWGAPEDCGNGILFNTYDSEGLWWGLFNAVENHRYFRNNRAEYQKQVKRIMARAREKWSMENMIAGYLDLYEKMIGKALI